MPRRKSLIAQMYEAHREAKLQRQKLEDQASRAWAEEERKAAAQAAKEAAQQRREEERTAQARAREEQQAERAAAQQERERERQAAAEARQHQRRSAEERREQQRREAERHRLAAEQRAAEAEFRTEAVRAQITAFERLLLHRNRYLAKRSRQAEDAFNVHGPEAFVEEVQRGLTTSVYPDGLDGSCAAQYLPESAELLVEYELPRQDVVPAVTGYRYVKTRDQIVPEPRKETERSRFPEARTNQRSRPR
jgi:restriction system protein